MKTAKSPRNNLAGTSWLLRAAGACLHLATALFVGNGGGVAFRAALCVWSLAPYLLLALALQRLGGGIGLLAGVVLMLQVDATTFRSVFVAPQTSTAALGLPFAPLLNLFCLAPLSIAAAAWLGPKHPRA